MYRQSTHNSYSVSSDFLEGLRQTLSASVSPFVKSLCFSDSTEPWMGCPRTLWPNQHQAKGQSQREQRKFRQKATRERRCGLGWEQMGAGSDPSGPTWHSTSQGLLLPARRAPPWSHTSGHAKAWRPRGWRELPQGTSKVRMPFKRN